MRKYHGEVENNQHGAGWKLNWPGTIDGFPVRTRGSSAVNLKQAELDELELQYDFKSKMFKLWDAADKQEFDDVNDKIVNGWYKLLQRSEQWDDEHKHYCIWMEWYQIYGVLPAEKS